MTTINRDDLQEYLVLINKMINQTRNKKVTFGKFIDLLKEKSIKFSCRDDLIRMNRIFPTPFDKLEIAEVLSYLQFYCLRKCCHTKSFFVKMEGRKNSDDISKSKIQSPRKKHPFSKCLQTLRGILTNLYGAQANWFSNLGGRAGTNTIKKQTLYNKIHIFLKNTQHCECISEIYSFLTVSPEQSEYEQVNNYIYWPDMKKRLAVNEQTLRPISLEKIKLNQNLRSSSKSQIRNRNSYIRKVIASGSKIKSGIQYFSKSLSVSHSENKMNYNACINDKNKNKRKIRSSIDHSRRRSQTESSQRYISSQLERQKFPIIHSYSVLNQRLNLSTLMKQRILKSKKNVAKVPESQIGLQYN